MLIQPMIDAQAAGVAFTVDPVSGHASITVEAVPGLGESLVSGKADPERWQIQDNEVIAPSAPSILDTAVGRALYVVTTVSGTTLPVPNLRCRCRRRP